MGSEEDLRLVLCGRCGSEGRILRHRWPNPPWSYDIEEEDLGECPECEGTGLSLVVTFPIELEDLEPIP